MAGLDDDTLIQLLQMTAETYELDPRKVEITEELEDEVEAYESALRDALEEVAMGFPPGRDVTAEDLWDAEASYLVLMTLNGEGVGIWDGSWDDFFDERENKEVQKLLKSRLRRFADDTGGGSLNQAFMNAAYETAGEPDDEEEEDEEEDEDQEPEDESGYEENVKWSRAYKNRLPDSAFLYIDRECVDHRDEQGRSHPLDCRVFPYKNQAGNVDLSHLRNALARIPVSDLPADVKRQLRGKAERLLSEQGGYERTEGVPERLAANITYKAATDQHLAKLQSMGWRVQPGLKVPWALSPDGETKLWFRPQAVYVGYHRPSLSLHVDMRAAPTEALIQDAIDTYQTGLVRE